MAMKHNDASHQLFGLFASLKRGASESPPFSIDASFRALIFLASVRRVQSKVIRITDALA